MYVRCMGSQLTICGYVIVTNCHCEVGPIFGSLSEYTTYYAAVMRVGFVVTNFPCEVGLILSSSSEYTTYYAAVMRVGFVVTNCHCEMGLILGCCCCFICFFTIGYYRKT